MRRVLTALLMALTLALSSVTPDVPCAKHEMLSDATAMMDMDHAMHAADTSPASHHEDREAPTECCRALASCTISLLADNSELSAPILAKADRPVDETTALSSRVVAPETPPPRA